MTFDPRLRRLIVASAWVVALAGILLAVLDVVATRIPGVDFPPVRHAGEALLSGHSVYTDPTFVYPPSSAPLFIPWALGSEHVAYFAWIAALAGAQVVAALLVVRFGGYRRSAAALPLLALGSGHVFALVLGIANLTLLLVPLAVAVVGCFHRGRWTLGCALLAASLLVKPLLIALVLVPIAHRRFRALATTMLPAVGVLALSMVVVPGGTNVGRFVGYVLSGTNLRGRNAMLNLSIAGWGETQDVPGVLALAGRALVLAVCAGAVVKVARSRGPASSKTVIQLALVACLTAMLAGRLSENHFLLPVLALALLRVALSPDRWTFARYGPVLLMLHLSPEILPPFVVGPAGNSWFVAAELTLFAVAAAEILLPRSAKRRAPRTRTARAGTPHAMRGVAPAAPPSLRRRDVVVAHRGEDRGDHGDVLLARVAGDDS